MEGLTCYIGHLIILYNLYNLQNIPYIIRNILLSSKNTLYDYDI